MAEFGMRRPNGCSLYEGGERRNKARKVNCRLVDDPSKGVRPKVHIRI